MDLVDISERTAPATLLSYEEVRPESFQGRRKSSRVQQYRRRLRRQRNRRIAVIIASITTTVSLGLAYKIHHPEFTFQQFIPVQTLNVTLLDHFLDTAGNQTHQFVKKVSGKGTIKEMKDEPKKRKKKKPEKVQKKEEPVVKKEPEVAETPNPQPTPIEPEKPPPMTTQLEVVKQDTEAFAIVPTPRRERRPILCNIPLAYLVHPRCRRLARENPLFNLQNLVQNMMQ